MSYWKKTYKPIDKEKIIKQVFGDSDRIEVHDVVDETTEHYICYSAMYGMEYKIRKNKKSIYTNREELKYIRWARRMHKKSSEARQRVLFDSDKLSDFKKRYIKEFPEYAI